MRSKPAPAVSVHLAQNLRYQFHTIEDKTSNPSLLPKAEDGPFRAAPLHNAVAGQLRLAANELIIMPQGSAVCCCPTC
jgi:hypothetical protein